MKTLNEIRRSNTLRLNVMIDDAETMERLLEISLAMFDIVRYGDINMIQAEYINSRLYQKMEKLQQKITATAAERPVDIICA